MIIGPYRVDGDAWTWDPALATSEPQPAPELTAKDRLMLLFTLLLAIVVPVAGLAVAG